MKHITLILIIVFSNIALCQSEDHKEKFRKLEPDIWLGIWDKENSGISLNIDTLGYDEIPKHLDFRGTVVEALRWFDSEGEKILIQTVTGHFNWKDYLKDSSEYIVQDKSELYAYLFLKPKDEKEFNRQWKVYDFTECFGVDWYTGFIPNATTLTDLDKNGITEISMPYVLICRGDVSPGTMKIITYESTTKYALRGQTMHMCDSDHPYGGEYQMSKNLKDNKLLLNFIVKHWNRNKCERGRFY